MFSKRAFVLSACLLVCVSFAPGQEPTPQSTSARDLFNRAMNSLMGSRVPPNVQRTLDDFRRSADLGYAPAQVVMGYYAETGSLTEQDPRQAADWYRKAADQGDSLAQWFLGRLYFTGSGVQRDTKEAESFLHKAAGHGDAYAEYLLARVYEERDYKKSPQWFRKAAEQGLPQAQYRLGVILKQGRGADVDKFEAYQWLLLSSEAGSQAATNELQALESELGSNQTERAQAAAREKQARTNRSAVAHGCLGWQGQFDDIPSPPPPQIQQFCR
jgi:TPR repeat protein